jgi:leader peptidase (prepilin peptidase) / N-methyltransferase
MNILIIIVIGLIIGSFLNALIHRIYSGQSMLSDRSRCVHCNHELSVKDLVPIWSFVLLGGKCRYCKKKISWLYLLVELVTALVLVLLAMNYEFRIMNLEFLVSGLAVSVLIVVAVYDFKHYLILDKIVIPAFVLIVAYNLFIGQFLDGLYGSMIISGFFLAQYLFSKGRWIGLGDVKLGLFLGSLVGWQLSLVLLMFAYFSGAVVGLGLIAMGHKKLGSHVPFGTFLSISAIIIMLYGHVILDWYLGLIGV